jgi:hypothetical protein
MFGELIDEAIDYATQPMEGKQYGNWEVGTVPIFKPTDDEAKQLGIVEVKLGGKLQRVATNKQLWQKLQDAHVAKLTAAKRKKAESKEGAAAKREAAERPQLTKEEIKRREQERSAQFRRRLDRWRADWLRYLIARQMRTGDRDQALAVADRVMIWCAVDHHGYSAQRIRNAAFKAVTGKNMASDYDGTGKYRSIAAARPAACVVEFASRLFHDDKDGPQSDALPDRVVAMIADELSIDVADWWQEELAGPLTEAYFELHTKDQLGELSRELRAVVREGGKAEMVRMLITSPETRKRLPRELAKGKKR